MIPKNKILFILVTFLLTNGIAQEKSTTYYDAFWNETTKEEASFYRNRPLEKKEDLVLVKDYYMNGNLQFVGWADEYREDEYSGEVTWYYENGKKEAVRNYEYGSLNGASKTYYPSGQINKELNFEDGYLNGEAKIYNETGELAYEYTNKNGQPYNGYTECLTLYKNGNPFDRKIMYESTNKLAYKKTCLDGKCTFLVYNIKGKLLSEFVIEQKFLEGLLPEYYSTSCSTAVSLKNLISYKGGKKEGEALFFDENENVLYTGHYKNDEPYSGTFYLEDLGFDYFTSYKNGKKEGTETTFKDGDLITKGEYKQGKRTSGTFITEEEFGGSDYLKLVTVANGKEEGKQSYYNYAGIHEYNLLGYYHAKNGILNGEKVVYYNYPEIVYRIIYKNGQPYEGSIVEHEDSGEALVYKEGNIFGKRLNQRRQGKIYWEYYNDNEELFAEEHPNFHIEGEEILHGTYKNGLPYQGYIVRPKAELYILDFYEAGIKKYQYSADMAQYDREETPENYNEELEPALRSIYKNDKIYTGLEFDTSGNSFSKKTLKEGVTKALSLYVFAMHYGNIINITTTETGYTITEAKYPKAKISATNGTISFLYDDEIIHRKNKDEMANLRVTYIISGDTIIPTKAWDQDLIYADEYRENYKTDFLAGFYTNIAPSEFEATGIFSKLENLSNDNDSSAVAFIQYNDKGLPYTGMLIEKLGENYEGTLYKKGKKSKILKNKKLPTLKMFFENNIMK
ncbi:MORN variant repeat-containing protein [Cellulophaga algicola DSM 14237]|uniref:MORN variant repeat-containing protein n=1 Tax=Cellulophaga algicola (strain DSM 14237 / IC166 / ACAM 630) TaxID=688270 RepID=E6X6I1_CELAD|nr:morn variant repeat-containing protein [Cellulophaga algicola]ADV48487.1 MORN variant repeat-containing protein [Cellulophaga algicola DSM 14237]